MALLDSRYAALLFLPYYTSVWLHRLNKASIKEGGQKKYETDSYIIVVNECGAAGGCNY